MYAGHAEMGETVARYTSSPTTSPCAKGFQAMLTAERDYEECGSYHTSKRNQEWYNLWNPVNPQSPLNVNKDGTVVRVQVTAVTAFFRKSQWHSELAQVRYLKGRQPARCRTEQLTPLDRDHRVRLGRAVTQTLSPGNGIPLGWRVTDFHTEPRGKSRRHLHGGGPPSIKGTPMKRSLAVAAFL